MREFRDCYHCRGREYGERDGESFTALYIVERPGPDYPVGTEVYRIRFDDGDEIDAYPDEILVA